MHARAWLMAATVRGFMNQEESTPSWLATVRNSVRVWSQRWQLQDVRTRVGLALAVASAATIATVLVFGELRWPSASPQTASASGVASGTPASASKETLSTGANTKEQTVQAAPASVGKRLAANRQLMLLPEARTQLTTGKVDQRVTSVLESLLGLHMVQVTTFGKAEPGVPLRSITIDCVDELPIKADSAQTTSVLHFFEQLRPPLAPESVRLAKQSKTTVIEVTYPVMPSGPIKSRS
jgi:hypothetical protein